MEHFIEKNLLIDDILELEITYIPEILDIFNELRNTGEKLGFLFFCIFSYGKFNIKQKAS